MNNQKTKTKTVTPHEMKCWNCYKKFNVNDVIHEVPIKLLMADYDHEMIQICEHCYNLME